MRLSQASLRKLIEQVAARPPRRPLLKEELGGEAIRRAIYQVIKEQLAKWDIEVR